jgi:LPS biosynthesis protein
MIIDQDIHNKLREQYNPEGSDLRTLQLHLLDILIEFDRICRKYGIDYWLDGGTLIGAARHDGFLPWDDDIDVCILRKDKKRLIRAMEKELKAPFKYDRQPFFWMKISNDNVSVTREVPVKSGKTVVKKENIWLDVFLIIHGTPSFSKKVSGFYGRCFRRRYGIINDGKLNRFIGTCLYPIALSIISVARMFGKILHPNSIIYDYGTGYYAERRKNEVFPVKDIEFEGHRFLAPHDTDKYLERIHGDWKTLPDNIFDHYIKRIDFNEKKDTI